MIFTVSEQRKLKSFRPTITRRPSNAQPPDRRVLLQPSGQGGARGAARGGRACEPMPRGFRHLVPSAATAAALESPRRNAEAQQQQTGWFRHRQRAAGRLLAPLGSCLGQQARGQPDGGSVLTACRDSPTSIPASTRTPLHSPRAAARWPSWRPSCELLMRLMTPRSLQDKRFLRFAPPPQFWFLDDNPLARHDPGGSGRPAATRLGPGTGHEGRNAPKHRETTSTS